MNKRSSILALRSPALNISGLFPHFQELYLDLGENYQWKYLEQFSSQSLLSQEKRCQSTPDSVYRIRSCAYFFLPNLLIAKWKWEKEMCEKGQKRKERKENKKKAFFNLLKMVEKGNLKTELFSLHPLDAPSPPYLFYPPAQKVQKKIESLSLDTLPFAFILTICLLNHSAAIFFFL